MGKIKESTKKNHRRVSRKAHKKETNSSFSKKDAQLRKIGIPILNDVPWGTHLCQFYHTKEDLIDILIPYFKAGLEHNEFCMWITSEPLKADEAKHALKKKLKNADNYIQKGQLEILDSTQWYTKSGKFDADEVLQGWVKKEAWARKQGYDGLRLTGNTFWLEKKDWEDFKNYEEAVNSVIGKYHMIAICSYSLDKCSASEIIDVVSNHQFSLIKRDDKWHRIENPEMKKAEDVLKTHQQLFETVVNFMPAAINLIRGHDLRLQLINPAYQAIAPGKDMIGKTLDELWPETGQNFSKLCRQVLATGKPYQVYDELNMIRRQPNSPLEPAYFSWSLNRVHLPGEDGWGILNIAWETTERKKIEEELLRNVQIFDQIQDGILIADPKFRITYWNKGAEQLFGYNKSEAMGMTTLELLKPIYSKGERKKILDELNQIGSLRITLLTKHKNGTDICTEVHAKRLTNESGEITGYVVTYRDVSESHKAEELLRETHDYLENLLNYANAPIIVWNKDFKISRFNHAFEHLTGFSSKEVIGKNLNILFPQESIKKSLQEIQRTLSGEYWESVEIPIRQKNGKTCIVLWNSANIYDHSGTSLIATIAQGQDITDRKKIEEDLLNSEERFRLAQRAAHIGNWDWNVLTNTLVWSEEMERMFGLKTHSFERTYEAFLKCVHPDDRSFVDSSVRATIERNALYDIEYRIIRPDKKIRWIAATGDVIRNKEGKIERMLGIVQDITEKKDAEATLQQTRDYLENLLNYANAPIIVWDKYFKIIRFNHAFEHLTGYKTKEVIGKNLDILFPKDSRDETVRKIKKTLRGEHWESVEIPILQKNGRIRIALWNSANVYDSSGKTLMATIAQGQDITDRKQIEEILRNNESQQKRAQELAHLGSWELDLIKNHLKWSDEVYRIFGLQPQEFKATYEAFLDNIHPDDRETVDKAYTDSIRQGKNTYEIEHRILRKNGEIRFVHEKCEHIRNLSGGVIRSIGMIHDITKTKKAETELSRLASFPLKNPNPIIEIDLSGKIQYLNPISQKFFPDLEKKEFDHPFLKDIKKLIPTIKKKKYHLLEVQINDKFFLHTITYIPENNRLRIYSTDITLLKKTEKTLQESEEKYRRIVENTTNVIMTTQPDGIISYLSPSSRDVLGYSPEELIGTNPMIFYPDDIEKIQHELARALKGEKGSNFEYRIVTKQGDIKWISHAWSPIFQDDQLLSIISIIADITERKITEEKIRKLNDNLIRRSIELAFANKELETFSYSVSHDLRAPLRSIDGFSQALLEDYGNILDENGKEYLTRVRKATDRMSQLIDDMLRLSRLTRVEMNMQQVDLGLLATTIIENLKKTEPGRKVTFVSDKELETEGDENLLKILLENLLGNAWKFTKKCSQTKIEIGKTQKGKDVVFFIRDNGAGFNMKYADKLFIPFQRLHDEADYPGTGIGLGIVSRIIHRHGGRIWAEAEENKGATFYFTIGGKTNE